MSKKGVFPKTKKPYSISEKTIVGQKESKNLKKIKETWNQPLKELQSSTLGLSVDSDTAYMEDTGG